MDTKQIDEILTYLTDQLGGDWLLAGGSLVRLVFDGSRGTEDIDLARMRESPHLSRDAALASLYQKLIADGLGPEWVNTALEPFVAAVPDWMDHVVLLKEGGMGRIFRPTLTLFAFLKLRRGTDIDMQDVRAAARACPEKFDEHQFMAWADPLLQARYLAAKSSLGLSE